MEKITDTEICEMLKMSPQNLRATYKKSSKPEKQLMYEALQIGLAEIKRRTAMKTKTTCTCGNCGFLTISD